MTFYRHIVFDLDDTLLDTSGGLVPIAARNALDFIFRKVMPEASSGEREAAIESGYKKRIDLLTREPRKSPWLSLAGEDPELAESARQVFLRPTLSEMAPELIRPVPGALDLLQWVESRATIHLVSSGDPLIQEKKLKSLGIENRFTTKQIVEAMPSPPNGKGPKYYAFEKLCNAYPDIPRQEFLSIGNRVDTDLAEAKLLHWKTVWIHFGEHAHLVPKRPNEIPDFEAATPLELLSLWKEQYPGLPSQ